jgi:branched-subunit amino acid transport protein
MTAQWTALIVASLGCYMLKLAGVSLPEAVLNHPHVKRIASLLPVAMLAALVTVQLFDHNGHYSIDWHTLAGVAAATIALMRRQPFLVVFIVAITVTALLRLVT